LYCENEEVCVRSMVNASLRVRGDKLIRKMGSCYGKVKKKDPAE